MLMFVTHYGSSWLLYPHPPSWRGGYIAITLSVRSHFRNRYLSFSWKKWFYIWYMALAWWLVPCLPFPGLPHIYFLFTVRLTNERVGVFLARHSVQHLVYLKNNTGSDFGRSVFFSDIPKILRCYKTYWLI